MNLDETQRKQVAAWIEQGLKISEVQLKLISEFGITMTYMETRFLLDDLALKPKDLPPPVPAAKATASSTLAQPVPSKGAISKDIPGSLQEAELASNVSVTVDAIPRPGALVSGKVTFSDQQTADWYLDQEGRLGVVAKQPGYKPSEEDVIDFQTELQTELAKLGFA